MQQEDVQQNYKDFRLDEDGIILYRNKFYVPDSSGIWKLILNEMHNVLYVGHQGYQNILEAVRK